MVSSLYCLYVCSVIVSIYMYIKKFFTLVTPIISCNKVLNLYVAFIEFIFHEGKHYCVSLPRYASYYRVVSNC